MMVSTPTPVDRSEAANNEDPPDREKEFFITWLRLMERQKDAAKLTQDMQSLLAEPGDVGLKLQSARRQANLQSDNDKSISEVVALLNDYFFRDIVPALKRAKESTNQPQDPLDQYLEHGEEVSQDFVDDMSGWGAEEQEKENDDEQQQQSAETQEDNNSDDEIPTLQHAAFQQEAQAASLTRQKSAPQFYTVDHIVDHRLFYNKRQYLVRWENYDKSEDTWQDGDQLRADVPEIVEAYEQQRQREATRDEVIQSAMAELIRDGTARPKTAAKKRAVPSAEAKESKDNIPSGDNINGSTPKQKKQRTITDKNDEDTYQFNVEEAELEEFSDDEFADKLNN
eukprot:jgi/Phyca11/532007/estExt2_fgenesh1_pg.C_PHYCAscaffold_30180